MFDTALNATTNRDGITDFEPGIDRLLLKASLFPGAGTVGATLAADRFLAGPGVVNGADANDFILLNTTTGVLAFDADANGKKASVAFAQLPLGVAALVTAADLQFIL